ncbi:glycoside hydrolase family 15 protein [Paraburkholderia sp.]|uniref:glycoside hydrolase family 15 protein n=1 Tax=Paraburkholderia sp. TaxID=1926495 RepID=UPI0025FBD791|nr:glycoside hydrolase family 15 protein [Paraburkholderia sp.]
MSKHYSRAISNIDDQIAGLGLVGDQRTAAVIDLNGSILWYCPGRFDRPSLFGRLLDQAAGSWHLIAERARPLRRRYIDESGILETALRVDGHEWTVTDFMEIADGAPKGALCRRFGHAPAEIRIEIQPRPNYNRDSVRFHRSGGAVVINDEWHLCASHPLHVADGTISFSLPTGEDGWAVLTDTRPASLSTACIDAWLDATLARWKELSDTGGYRGPYRREVLESLRALRLLHHRATGGIIAAATSSLPETIGGSANWDYRYVWLRDASMIVSALVRAGVSLNEGERYLDFICSSLGSSPRYPLAVLTTLDHERAPDTTTLPLSGYQCSAPVRAGNSARDQIQLDGYANVLLSAKLVYERRQDRPHWKTIARIADFLVTHWTEPDHGIWEEPVTRH